MSHLSKIFTCMFLFIVLVTDSTRAQSKVDSLHTKIIMLGTGTPYPDPSRAGAAVAITYGDRFFLFDVGAGVERRINAAKLPVSGPEATFITHLHTDHTLGYPDLIFTSWVIRRNKPLQVYGPKGLQRMTNLIMEAWSEDVEVRINGLEKEQREFLEVKVHEIQPRVVYDSAGIRITAIPVLHGNWNEAFGYRIDTPDRSIVISGDTRPCEALQVASKNVDVLIHEAYCAATLKAENRPGGEYWIQYNKEFHTSDVELGQIAKAAQPKLLILTHIGRGGATDETLMSGVKQGGFEGKTFIAKDLDVY